MPVIGLEIAPPLGTGAPIYSCHSRLREFDRRQTTLKGS